MYAEKHPPYLESQHPWYFQALAVAVLWHVLHILMLLMLHRMVYFTLDYHRAAAVVQCK